MRDHFTSPAFPLGHNLWVVAECLRLTTPERRLMVGAPAGNQNAARHGLYTNDRNALRLRTRAVRRLVDKAYQVASWLTETDLLTVRAWAEVVKLKAIAFVALEREGIYRVDGEDLVGRRMLEEYRRLSQ